jgi:hypothetical protein
LWWGRDDVWGLAVSETGKKETGREVDVGAHVVGAVAELVWRWGGPMRAQGKVTDRPGLEDSSPNPKLLF